MSIANVADYLNDHLAGSSAALELLKHLVDLKKGEERIFYRKLHREIEADQKILKKLLQDLQKEKNILKQMAGGLAEKAGRFKMHIDGMKEGELGLLEAHEILVLGITGKNLLWRALGEVSSDYPAWKGISFTELEHRAEQQRDRVERRRIKLAAKVFST